ncbi:hypothetical protein M5K25_012565 [Dendrobium thyrsiflorum]|uniref:Uncharacterized protein n=1 Tax=Dendrobium thyrsiflorum TaxID=117978 RepID=A0ABD0UXI2_DENTH
MVGGVMMSPIKIPWFRRPGPSWSLVYLVRGGSRPNLTEGSLSAAMGFDAIGEHTGDDHDRNIIVPFGGKPSGSKGPGRNRLPTVPFGGKTVGVVPFGRRNHRLEDTCHIRWRCITFQWPVVFTTDSLLLPTDSLFSFTGSVVNFSENFGSLPASPPLGENFRRLQSHHVTRTCMVGVRGHRSRTILSPTTLLERVWGLHVYLSERGAVVSPQAGTYEYPFLAVGVAPGSLLPCYESAYRWFSGPSQTPKKNLLDHPFRHKHRDALPPTTSKGERGKVTFAACKLPCCSLRSDGKGKSWTERSRRRRRRVAGGGRGRTSSTVSELLRFPSIKKCRNFRLNREGTSPEETKSNSQGTAEEAHGRGKITFAASGSRRGFRSEKGKSSNRAKTNGGSGVGEGARKGEGYLHSRRAPVVASDQTVVTSDPKEREVVERAESNGSEGVERDERERMKCGSLSPRSFLPSIANDVRSWGIRRRRANDVRRSTLM